MTVVVVIGALLAALGGALSARDAHLALWRRVAGLAALVVGLGLLRLAPAGEVPGTIVLSAQAGGQPAVTRVVVETAGSGRETFAVPLQHTVQGAPVALWTLVGLGLLCLVAARRLGRLTASLPLVAAAAGAVLFLTAAGGASGEAAVRAFLSRALANVQIGAFTVPPEGWTYPGGGLALGCGVAAGVALWITAREFTKEIKGLAVLVPTGAAVALVGCGGLLLAAGGPWWTPAESLAVAAVLTLGGASFMQDHPGQQAALLSVGCGLAGLAAGAA
jgi:hypothetical protein